MVPRDLGLDVGHLALEERALRLVDGLVLEALQELVLHVDQEVARRLVVHRRALELARRAQGNILDPQNSAIKKESAVCNGMRVHGKRMKQQPASNVRKKHVFADSFFACSLYYR